MDKGRGVGQHGQRGAFRPGKFVGRPAEIAPGGGFKADHVAAERRVGGVQRQDLVFAAVGFQPQGQGHFEQFLPDGAGLATAAQADDLHGQGAGAAAHLAFAGVQAKGPGYGKRVDAGMMAESFVFKGDDATREFLGHAVGSRKTPLAVGGDAGPQQPSVPALQHGAHGVVEQVSRTQEQGYQCEER